MVEETGPVSSVKSKETDPVILQEQKNGNTVRNIIADVYIETSSFKGKEYASIRRWFKADDGMWYRTKNGLSVLKENMRELLAQAPELLEFINEH